jgi:hypothetical protein
MYKFQKIKLFEIDANIYIQEDWISFGKNLGLRVDTIDEEETRDPRSATKSS